MPAECWRECCSAPSRGSRRTPCCLETLQFAGAPKIVRRIARGDYRDKTRDAIRGSGYVVDCLEAALWCVWTTDSFETAILEATNLGDDADTTAAVAGQVAGAFYGIDGIPRPWRDKVAMADFIIDLADRLTARTVNSICVPREATPTRLERRDDACGT